MPLTAVQTACRSRFASAKRSAQGQLRASLASQELCLEGDEQGPSFGQCNSRIYDLLRAPGETNPVALSLRSTGEGFEVSGATLERVHSRQDLLDLVTRASANRAIGTNNVHAHMT